MTKKEALTMFSWFNVYQSEVDIEKKDMEVLKKYIYPNLPKRFEGTKIRIQEKFNNR